MAMGVEIRDRDGILVTEPEGMHFLQALKEYENRFAKAIRSWNTPT